MSKTSSLSKNYLVSLSKNTQTMQIQPEPILQILGFEPCYYSPNTQIIIRLSDQTTFIDCSLIGSYCLLNDKIVSKQNYVSVEFQKNDLVRLSDFYMKIDPSRICKLRIVIRKMYLAERCQERKGNPFQLAQYIQYCQRQDKSKTPQSQIMGTSQKKVISKQMIKIEEDEQNMQVLLNINDNNQKNKHAKIEKNLINLERNEKIQDIQQNQNQNDNQDRSINKNNFQQCKQPNNKKHTQEQSLTLHQILNNEEGFFIGRLLRIKLYTKQTKDGSLSILILGFVDRLGNIVRVNLAGKWALKQSREVKKNRCYYISALETIRLQRTNQLQIRLKDKQSKLLEIESEKICRDLMVTAFYWDHEHSSQDVEDDYFQNVDVVGMIEDIEQKTKYQYKHAPQGRQVIRIVIINRLKTVKISFWGHFIKVLQDMKLKKRMLIVFMDIKRKKSSYLDFTVESSFIKLEEDPLLRKQLQPLLPELEQRQSPKNIEQLSKILEQETLSLGKTYSLNLFLASLDQNRLIFKLCQKCKQKLDLDCTQCHECKICDFYYKYNCQVELADWSGSISCVLFDHCANKVLGMTAVEVQTMKNGQNPHKIQEKIQQCLFKQFEVGLQMRNKKIIIKSMRVIEEDSIGKYIKSNILQIKNKLQPY